MKLLVFSAFLILIMSIVSFADEGEGGEGGEGGDGGCEGGGGGGGDAEGGDGACEGGDEGGGGGSSCQCSSGQVQWDGACGLCGTLRSDCDGCNWGGWYCSSQGACSPGQTQCSGSNYQTCSSSCQWQNSGTDADSDGVDLQCGDSLCDNSPGIYDSTKQQTEAVCTDSLDNDCNLKTDCLDTFCSSTLYGKVTDSSNNSPLEGSKVEVKDKELNTIATMFTNSSGDYQASVLCGTHYMVVSKESYVTGTKSNVAIPPQSTATEDFELSYTQVCESDCTFTGEDIIHKGCGDINGCTFYDEQASLVCDKAQPGWKRNYNDTHQLVCASGIPTEQVKTKAIVTCEDENLVMTTKVVSYQGQLAKLVVVTCG